jgi:hypothetical protein
MSGGRFNGDQRRIGYIVEDIKETIERSGRPKTEEEKKDEGWNDVNWYVKYPEDLNWHAYPPEILDKFKEAIYYLERAQIYAQRVDYYLSGDDGEETFLERLDEELSELKVEESSLKSLVEATEYAQRTCPNDSEEVWEKVATAFDEGAKWMRNN